MRIALTLIAVFLGIVALQPFFNPPATHAQVSGNDIYIEPGIYSLRAPDGTREQLGKVVVDLKTGIVWGFPTGVNLPYPIVTSQSAPPVSRPFQLAKYDFASMK